MGLHGPGDHVVEVLGELLGLAERPGLDHVAQVPAQLQPARVVGGELGGDLDVTVLVFGRVIAEREYRALIIQLMAEE